MDPGNGPSGSRSNEQSGPIPGVLKIAPGAESWSMLIQSSPPRASSSSLASPNQDSEMDMRSTATIIPSADTGGQLQEDDKFRSCVSEQHDCLKDTDVRSAGLNESQTRSISRFPTQDVPDVCEMGCRDLIDGEPSNYRHHGCIEGFDAEDLEPFSLWELMTTPVEGLLDERFIKPFCFDDGIKNELEPPTSESTNTKRPKQSLTKRKIDDVEPGTRSTSPVDTRGPKSPSRPSNISDKSGRYVIHTNSDVDIIDDGYRWRKYGQKPVKNSHHPRNYYKCTTPNCLVKKQVERCTENPSNVMTTYYGTHNHPQINSAGQLECEPTPHSNISLVPGEYGPRVPHNYCVLPDHALRRRRLNHPQQGGPFPQRPNIDLRGLQFSPLSPQYFLSEVFRSMSGNLYPRPRPPLADSRLDPGILLALAQIYSMWPRGQVPGSAAAYDLQSNSQLPGPSSPLNAGRLLSIQQRILWLQNLMGEDYLTNRMASQQSSGSEENPEGPLNSEHDLGNPSSSI